MFFNLGPENDWIMINECKNNQICYERESQDKSKNKSKGKNDETKEENRKRLEITQEIKEKDKLGFKDGGEKGHEKQKETNNEIEGKSKRKTTVEGQVQDENASKEECNRLLKKSTPQTLILRLKEPSSSNSPPYKSFGKKAEQKQEHERKPEEYNETGKTSLLPDSDGGPQEKKTIHTH